MKLKNLIMARRVIQSHKDEKLPTSLAYKFMKFLKASDEEDAFYNEKIRAIIDEFGVCGEGGNILFAHGEPVIKDGKQDEYTKAIFDVQDTDVEIIPIKFTVDELSVLKFSISEMYAIDELIKTE